MATSAFRSTSRRTSIGPSSTATGGSGGDPSHSSTGRSSSLRRSRSLSRVARRLPERNENPFSDETPAPRGRFVNTVRGSGFPEISLDDLAVELFSSGDRGRSADVSPRNGESVAQRRGRSVSRQSSKAGGGGGGGVRRSVSRSSGGGKGNSESNSRRRRSVSVVGCPISDSESDLDHPRNATSAGNLKNFRRGNNEKPLMQKPKNTNVRQGLRRSSSQKDFKYYDGYSSHSSALTDDEARDPRTGGNEKTIRAVYAQKLMEHPTGEDMKSGLYGAMREEVRHVLKEFKMEIEEAMLKSNKTSLPAGDDSVSSRNSDVLHSVSTIMQNYSAKLEQSEKRKQDLLAEIMMEEQRGRELSKIVKDLLPEPNTTVPAKPMRTRRSSDRSRMSKSLTEEAEKYIEDFISNVEDTDISSLDGERSDTSSTLGGPPKPDTLQSPTMSRSVPVEMDGPDGVVLPWLRWETSTDNSPLSTKKNFESPVTALSSTRDAVKDASGGQEKSYSSGSSYGSWSPGNFDGSTFAVGEHGSKSRDIKHCRSSFNRHTDVDDYLMVQSDEDFLSEMWRQQSRINSGGLLLCTRMFF